MNLSVRWATAADTPGVVGVIRAVYDEYGFIWDPDDYHADLYDLQSHYLDRGHGFWIAHGEDGETIGTIAMEYFAPVSGAAGSVMTLADRLRLGGCDCALERFYVHRLARRRGAGSALMERAIQESRDRGCRLMEIWSDKRFLDAHRLYERLGARTVGERICHDPDQSPEWGLILSLG